MDDTVTVSNLPSGTTEEDIRELFSLYGEIEILNLTVEAQSCTAEVQLKDEETATQAIAGLSGTHLEDRFIEIQRSVPDQPPPEIISTQDQMEPISPGVFEIQSDDVVEAQSEDADGQRRKPPSHS